jgi:hypothetical protein
MAARIPMMVITTSSSMIVKPDGLILNLDRGAKALYFVLFTSNNSYFIKWLHAYDNILTYAAVVSAKYMR